MKLESIWGEIDTAMAAYLETKEPKSRGPIQLVLDASKRSIRSAVEKHAQTDGDGNVDEILDLCNALDQETLSYPRQILKGVGAEDLSQKILDVRREIKWKIISEEIDKLFYGEKFSIGQIQRRKPSLFTLIKKSLEQELDEKTEKIDIEELRKRLSPTLQNRLVNRYRYVESIQEEAISNIIGRMDELDLLGVARRLGSNPRQLDRYLRLSHPELSEEETADFVYVSFSGLRVRTPEKRLHKLLESCQPSLDPIQVHPELPSSTNEESLTIQIEIPKGANRLLVRGPINRDIKVDEDQDQEIELRLPLEKGQENTITLLAYNESINARSTIFSHKLTQTGQAYDPSEHLRFLAELKQDTLDAIQNEESRAEAFIEFLEDSSILAFTKSFAHGEAFLRSKLAEYKHPFIARCIEVVIERFRAIDAISIPNMRSVSQSGRPIELLFFQKFCIYKIQKMKAEGREIAILANEPGLGKTLTALACFMEDELLIVCPNPAAPVWIEQEAKFFQDPFLLGISGLNWRKRKEALEGRADHHRGVVTNVEFIRKTDGQIGKTWKHELLNKRHPDYPNKTIILDEAHFLKNESQQTKGFEKLEGDFTLVISASIYKDPDSLCRVMRRFYPDDPRFENIDNFNNSFPKTAESLRTLHIMMKPYMVRFLKEDVMETYDPDKEIDEQGLCLPKKRFMSEGEFELLDEQQEAIYLLFKNWEEFEREYGRFMPKGEIAKLDKVRKKSADGDRLSKEHALRHITNNPKNIGCEKNSPKLEAAWDILEKEIGTGNKALVFCQYHSQIEAYQKLLDSKGIKYATFTGKTTRKGPRKRAKKLIPYEIDKYGDYVIGADGRPQEFKGDQQTIKRTQDKKWKALAESEYQRLCFQNDPSVKVCLATYGAASQSVTLTAADVEILDDPPKDIIEMVQAEDRIHRVDAERPKKEVRYYKLISKYSEAFLSKMKEETTNRRISWDEYERISVYDYWFKQGSFENVRYNNLMAQLRIFQIINNGVFVNDRWMPEEVKFTI